MQYILTGEGRLRPDSSSGLPAGGFTYDYFLRDHLGDVRSVITEQTSENTYAATMENKNATVENQLFDNVSSTQYFTPTGFNNPVDTSNHYVSKLDGSNGNNTLPRVGPAIVLKVMAGDTVTIATQAWYTGAVEPPPSGASNLLNDLLSALTGGVISNSHSLYSTSDNNPNTVLSGDLPQFFTNDENNHYSTSAPKAFLNYVAFDNQLNMNAANSGVVQVPTITGSEAAQPLIAPEQIIQKDGYLYIYVSNESAQKVFFDNLVIHHNKGHLLEEDQYYPFGLKMAGISDEALPVVPNNYLYNGKELQQNEFNDGTGLENYDYGFRGYDPQLGRFTEQDPLTDNFATVSPYQYGLNDPVANIDKDGLAALPTVSVFATAVSRMSAFSSFTSKLLGEASLASKVINFSSLGAHVLQTGGVIGLSFLTRSIGMKAASNLGGPGHNKKNKKGGKMNTSFRPSETYKYSHNLFATTSLKMDAYTESTFIHGTSPVEFIIDPVTKKKLSVNYYSPLGVYNKGMDNSFSAGNSFLSFGISGDRQWWTIDISIPLWNSSEAGVTFYFNSLNYLAKWDYVISSIDQYLPLSSPETPFKFFPAFDF